MKNNKGIILLSALPTNEWVLFNDIPKDISIETFSILESGFVENRRVIWDEINYEYFKLTPNTTKSILIKKLAHLENRLEYIEWVCILTKKLDYIITIDNGIIKSDSIIHCDTIFKPETHILNMFEWIYYNATDLKFKYL